MQVFIYLGLEIYYITQTNRILVEKGVKAQNNLNLLFTKKRYVEVVFSQGQIPAGRAFDQRVYGTMSQAS